MPVKSPDEVNEALRHEMEEIIGRVRTEKVKWILWESLCESDRKWLEKSLTSQEAEKFGAIQLWMKLRGVSDARAALDVALKCELLSQQKYKRLLRDIGAHDEGHDVDVYDAIKTAKLVLIENPREAHWNGQVIEIKCDDKAVLWNFLWELAGAAKHRGSIDERNFGLSSKRNVTNWKSRLLNTVGFPIEMDDTITSKSGKHRLDLPPDMIRRFRQDPNGGCSEIVHNSQTS